MMSIFTAECIALNEAVDFALSHSDQSALIFTDSLSALLKLKSRNVTIKINPTFAKSNKNYRNSL